MPPTPAEHLQHTYNTLRQITPGICDLPGPKPEEINTKTNGRTELVSIDFLIHRGPPKSTNTDTRINKRSPLISIDFRAPKIKKEAPK